MSHPARFSPQLLPTLANALSVVGLPVHDPYAGTGERLGALCDSLGLTFTGTEIEGPFIIDPRVRQGDSTLRETYPPTRHVVCTSPSYPNGMSDHFRARDASKRNTYRQGLAAITGEDRPLNMNNTARYGRRGGKKAEARYWELQTRVVDHWPPIVIVNVKDFFYDHDHLYPLVLKWTQLLTAWDYDVKERFDIPCPGQRHGANRKRVDTEAVLIAER